MNNDELFVFFKELEDKIPNVTRWSYDGMDLWPIVRGRTMISILLSELSSNKDRKHTPRERLLKIVSMLWYLICIISKLPFTLIELIKSRTSVDVFFLSFTGNKNVKVRNGKMYDTLLDPIAESVQRSGFSLINFDYAGPAKIRNSKSYRKSVSVDPIVVLALIRSVCSLIIFFLAQRNIVLEQFDDVASAIQLKYSVRVKKWKVIGNAIFYQSLSAFFKSYLKVRKPKVAMVRCYYGPVTYAIVYACKELKIPVCDVQHGSQGRYHPAYSGISPKYNTIPSFFWNWRQVDADFLSAQNCRAYVGGIPINHAIGTLASLFAADLKTIEQIKKKKVLITLSWGMANDFLEEMFRLQDDSMFFFVRLHPSMKKTEQLFVINILKNKSKSRCDLEIANKLPLPLLIAASDVNVTMFSSTIIESFELKTPSIGLNPKYCRDYYPEVIRCGGLMLADNVEIAIELIKTKVEKKPLSSIESQPLNFSNFLLFVEQNFPLEHIDG